MQTIPKHPFPRKPRVTSRQIATQLLAERDRWKGLEHTKAYRFRNSGNRYRVRGW